jgi:hypothetical protein
LFLQSFYHERLLNFFKSFFCIYWDVHVTFVLDSYVLYYIYWFAYFEPALHPWNETNLIFFIVWSFSFVKCGLQKLYWEFLWDTVLSLNSGPYAC